MMRQIRTRNVAIFFILFFGVTLVAVLLHSFAIAFYSILFLVVISINSFLNYKISVFEDKLIFTSWFIEFSYFIQPNKIIKVSSHPPRQAESVVMFKSRRWKNLGDSLSNEETTYVFEVESRFFAVPINEKSKKVFESLKDKIEWVK